MCVDKTSVCVYVLQLMWTKWTWYGLKIGHCTQTVKTASNVTKILAHNYTPELVGGFNLL